MVLALLVAAPILLAIGAAGWRAKSLHGRPVTVHLDTGEAIDGLLVGRGPRLMRLANAEAHTDQGMVPMDGEYVVIEVRRVTVWQVRV